MKEVNYKLEKLHLFFWGSFLSLTFFFVSTAEAGSISMRKRIIRYSLPDFCIYTQGWSDTDINKYKLALKKYGFGWSHMHHYCNGIEELYKAFSIIGNPKQRVFHLKQAVGQFGYVLRNTDKKFSLRPMVLVKHGYALLQLKKPVEAFKDYQMAARLKKNYIMAYLGMADCYLKLGDKKGAVKILKIGLRYSPKSESLKKKLAIIHQKAVKLNEK